jgi:hypothetical protein
MQDERKRVSQFPGRRSEIAKAVASVITNDQPAIGGTQGEFQRQPCGTCLSWRRDKRAGTQGVPLSAGQCMYGPPTPHPIMTETGQMIGAMALRPPMQSDSEGCDQHDDGHDDDGEQVPLLASTG